MQQRPAGEHGLRRGAFGVAALVAVVVAIAELAAASAPDPVRGPIAAAIAGACVLTGGIVLARRARETTRALELVQDALVSKTSTPMVLVDHRGTIIRANAAAGALFGYDAQQLEGRTVEDLLPEHRQDDHRTQRERYLENPHPREMAERRDLTIQRSDGSELQVRISLTPLPQLDAPPLVAATILDVTELASKAEEAEDRARSLAVTLEREVAAMDRLRDLDRTKDVLLTAISHEIRTPLTVLVGVADVLDANYGTLPEDKARMLIGRLKAQSHKLAQLVEDLLDLERLQRGQMGVHKELVRVDVIARETAATASAAYERRIEVNVPPVTARLDPQHLARMLDNLLSNACKYAPDGHIYLDGTGVENGRVQLAVEDEGESIPPARRASIFEPFERGIRLDSASPGVGIGLALVRRLAEGNGGTCWIEDGARTGGARFVLELPALGTYERRLPWPPGAALDGIEGEAS